jgi:hypothetical protein
MTKKDERAESYVHQVRENTQQLSGALLDENQHLRKVLASLLNEKLAYHEQNVRLKADLEGQRRQREELKAQLDRLESEHRRFTEQYLVVEQQNNNLAQLYVASYRLHSTLEWREVLAVIQEIVVNLIGCEELALFELLPDGRELRLLHAHGVEPQAIAPLHHGDGAIARAAQTGERWIGARGEPARPEEARLTACIPLKLSGQVTGVIALFQLLGHKSELESIDLELFDLLATHAATALHSSLMHSRIRSAGARW